MFGFTEKELRVLRGLKTPRRIQDFLNKIPAHKPSEARLSKSLRPQCATFDGSGEEDTCMSPRMVLQRRRAHCVEGALLAAAALRIHGRPSLILDLTATKHDLDHVIAVFREGRFWGAISKTNHAILRFREPVYASVRELVMSYFHEYTDDRGLKTLRSYSAPINLSRFDKCGWMTAEEDVWYIPEFLCEVPHKKILTRSQIAKLRKADPIEIKIGKLLEWPLS